MTDTKYRKEHTHMKKQISTVLCLSILAAAMASCGSEGTEQPVTQAQTTETEAVVTEESVPLPEADFAGADIKILTAAEQWELCKLLQAGMTASELEEWYFSGSFCRVMEK